MARAPTDVADDEEAAMDFDVIIMGTGQAGVPPASRLPRDGRSVVLAEHRDLGGTCVNTGCTPTKTLVASARAAHVARSGVHLGVHAEAVDMDFPVHAWTSSMKENTR